MSKIFRKIEPELFHLTMDEQPRNDNLYFVAFKSILLVAGWVFFGVGVYYSYANSYAVASLYLSLGIGLLYAYIELAKTGRA